MTNIIPIVFLISIILCMQLPKSSSSPRNSTEIQQQPLQLYFSRNLFHRMVQDEYYVDKSSLLKVLFDKGHWDDAILITMPKGFGKTTNLKMIETFSEIEVDSKTGLLVAENITDTPNYKLFTGKHKFGEFEIANDTEFIQQHLGKYPVIFLDFSVATAINNVEDVENHCSAILHAAYKSHRYLMRSRRLTDGEKGMVEYWSNDTFTPMNVSYYLMEAGLHNLIDYLYTHFKSKVIVLADELDIPFQALLMSRLNDERVIEDIFLPITGMLSKGLKDNGRLKFSVLSGTMYFGFGSLGFNEPLPMYRYFFARNSLFWPYYGFTSQEVDHLLSVSSFKSNTTVRKLVDEYYDGYRVDNNRIYTPTSIIGFLHEGKIDQYWSQANDLILNFWKALRVYEIRRLVLDLIDNKRITIEKDGFQLVGDIHLLKRIIETECMSSVTDLEESIFFNLILDLGYLRILSSNDTHCEVDLPNNEIRADMLQFLNLYQNNTVDDEEIRLQRTILNSLTQLNAADYKLQLQSMTEALNSLCQTVIPRFYKFPYKDSDHFKKILSDTFRLGNINYYRELRTESPNCTKKIDVQANYEKLDFLITNLTTMYVFIETKYGGAAEKGFQQIIDWYLALKDSTEYPMTQPYYLLLGINLSYRNEISVSYGLYHKNETEIFTETLTAATQSESAATQSESAATHSESTATHSESTVKHSEKPIDVPPSKPGSKSRRPPSN